MVKQVTEHTTIMRGRVKLEIGCRLFFPYSSEVGAGEPSDWKNVHHKYNEQECVVVSIVTQNHPFRDLEREEDYHVELKVRFPDGFEVEATPSAFIYVGPPSGPPVTKKKKSALKSTKKKAKKKK